MESLLLFEWLVHLDHCYREDRQNIHAKHNTDQELTWDALHLDLCRDLVLSKEDPHGNELGKEHKQDDVEYYVDDYHYFGVSFYL